MHCQPDDCQSIGDLQYGSDYSLSRPNRMKETIIQAFALVLIIEGLGPLLFPNKWSQYVQMMLKEGPHALRMFGGFLTITGILVLALFG